MCRSDTRGGRRSQNAGKIRTVAGRFRTRFDDIEDRSGTARFAGANDVEIDADDGVVLEKQRTQHGRINGQNRLVETCRRTELQIGDWMIRQS